MRNNWLVRTGLLAVLASLAVSAPVGLAVPPPLDITESSVVGGLDSRQKGQVGERLKYWGRQSVDADPNDANAIIDARTKALLDYSRINTVAHQDEFARQAAGILTPLLQSGIPKDDKLLSLKLVNVALVLAKMDQVTIEPALKSMVSHSNQAVRYLG